MISELGEVRRAQEMEKMRAEDFLFGSFFVDKLISDHN